VVCVVPFNRLGTATFSLVNGPLNVHICERTLEIQVIESIKANDVIKASRQKNIGPSWSFEESIHLAIVT
jgi:hypothetical protein